jgi:hypothetical protein
MVVHQRHIHSLSPEESMGLVLVLATTAREGIGKSRVTVSCSLSTSLGKYCAARSRRYHRPRQPRVLTKSRNFEWTPAVDSKCLSEVRIMLLGHDLD